MGYWYPVMLVELVPSVAAGDTPTGVRTELMKRFSSPYMNIALYRILH